MARIMGTWLVLSIALASGCGHDADGDGFESSEHDGTDCDDENPAINPGAAEVYYDAVDQNCDGLNDFDADGDGFDSAEHVEDGTDCDDSDATVNIEAIEIFYDGVDQDCDGWSDFDADGDGFDSSAHLEGGTDCNDDDATIHVEATEIYYDGVDQNCDEWSDYDADGDGFDSDLYGGTDCDDDDAAINTGATETYYDGVDQNCDEWSDYDADGDGFDSDLYSGTDCDDDDAAINTDATETYYDGVDQDCDGWSDYDADGDGFDSDLYSGTDCDDDDSDINTDATETYYDGVDQDCDGWSDYDADGDGFDMEIFGGTDCEDSDALINPAAEDYCDDIDQDCDGIVAPLDTVSIGSSNFTSIQDAVDAAVKNDTITVCEGTYIENISLNQKLTIEGKSSGNPPIIDADSNGSGITVGSKGTLTISGVDFRNGTGTDWTEASTGDTYLMGGCLDAFDAARLTLTDVNFSDCSAGYGGAIAVPMKGDSLLTRVTIEASDAEFYGGGIYLEGDGSGNTLTVDDCTLDNLSAGGLGGAIVAYMGGANMVVKDSSFSNTDAEWGGAIMWWDSEPDENYPALLSVSGSSFEYSSAVYGGAIYSEGFDTELEDTTFNQCTASGWGGALYLGEQSFTLLSTDITWCDAGNGGGLSIVSADGSISDSTVENSSADFGGGMTAWRSAITGAGFNLSNNDATISGGGAYSSGVNVSGLNISSNSAEYGGGVFFDSQNGSSSFSDSTVLENLATTQGGGFDVNGEVSVFGVDLTDNRSQEAGGAFYIGAGASVTIEASTVLENTAFTGGGGAFIDTESAVAGLDSLVSSGTDWGEGSTDNSTEDVTIKDIANYTINGEFDFSCSAAGETCQ